ncbi:hypothetical protein SGA02_24130 [Staphylococcus gallinarum]|uniref:Uncharacterized protein n=2 Tax=Staphylococcus gallinarum TaxID=1293 RepID=A0ABQ0Y5D4_STAGA|nr:hypothetical protein SGA02_24130 [Staphylococcus gallinarum]
MMMTVVIILGYGGIRASQILSKVKILKRLKCFLFGCLWVEIIIKSYSGGRC